MASDVTLTIVPLEAVPSQAVQIILGGQNCLIRVYQKSTGLFFDLLVKGEPVVLGRICLDRNKLVRYVRLNFGGELFFVDDQGTSDPEYSELGERYKLFYAAS